MKGGKCQGYEEGCPNIGLARGKRITTGLVTLQLNSSFMLMCGVCKQARLKKYPELVEFQSRKREIEVKVPDGEEN